MLDTSQGKQILTNITDAEKAILQAPVDVAIKGWLIVAGVTAALGLTIWYTESKLSQHQGTGALVPGVEPVHVAPGPSFGAAGQTSVAAGPFRVGGGVSGAGQGGSPNITYNEGGGGGHTTTSGASATTLAERRVTRASQRASIAQSKLSEERANATRSRGFA